MRDHAAIVHGVAVRILFLDFDGVLNSADWMKRRPSKEEFAGEFGISPEQYDHDHRALRSIDPDAVAALDTIVRLSGARVVVSSTWRTMYALPKLEWMLRQRGFTHVLLGTTPDASAVRARDDRRISRGEEITKWLAVLLGHDLGHTPVGVAESMVNVEDIVIIDDESDMDALAPRLYQTDVDVGLRAEHVDAVVGMFG